MCGVIVGVMDPTPPLGLPPFKDLLDTVAVQTKHAADLGVAHTVGTHLDDRGLSQRPEFRVPLPHQCQPSADFPSAFCGVSDVLNLVDVGQRVLHSMIVRGLPTPVTVVGGLQFAKTPTTVVGTWSVRTDQ